VSRRSGIKVKHLILLEICFRLCSRSALLHTDCKLILYSSHTQNLLLVQVMECYYAQDTDSYKNEYSNKGGEFLQEPSFSVFKVWVNGRSLAGIAGTSPASGMFVSCERCELSSRGICVRLITRP
jgi:hypothetical protein